MSREHRSEGNAFRQLITVRVHLLATVTSRQAEVRYLELFGLRLLEARTVLLLGAFKPMTLKAVCHETNIEKAYASKMIDRLVAKNLVEKRPHERDQRSIQLQLTDAGRSLYADLYMETVERNEQLTSALTEEERSGFMSCIEKLMKAAREPGQSGGARGKKSKKGASK